MKRQVRELEPRLRALLDGVRVDTKSLPASERDDELGSEVYYLLGTYGPAESTTTQEP